MIRYLIIALPLVILSWIALPNPVKAECPIPATISCTAITTPGDMDLDGDVDCDDEELFTCYIKAGSGPGQADINCDGFINVPDGVIFRQIMDACTTCAQTVDISCGASGDLQATPSNITASPGDWIRFAINVDCDDFCSSSRRIVINAPDLLDYSGTGDVHCSVKIPTSATAGSYKYSVTMNSTGSTLCTAITNNPLDPYITVADVSGIGETEKPASNLLSLRNAPNPFTPATSIHYLLSEESTVTVVIYDLHGSRIRTLVSNHPEGAGDHFLRWDGKNDFGEDLPSGVYIYNVTTNERSVSQRMVLAR